MLSCLGELETALNSSHAKVANERQSRLTLSLVNPSPVLCRTYDLKSRGSEISDHTLCEWLAAWESLVYGVYGAIPRSLVPASCYYEWGGVYGTFLLGDANGFGLARVTRRRCKIGSTRLVSSGTSALWQARVCSP